MTALHLVALVYLFFIHFFTTFVQSLSRTPHHIMGFSQLALLACLTVAEAATTPRFHSLQPVRRADDSLPAIFGSNGTTTLKGTTSSPDVVILDYGANVEGHPTFEVLSATGDTSGLEITYSETRAVLDAFYTVSLTPHVILELILIHYAERWSDRLGRSYGHLQSQSVQCHWAHDTYQSPHSGRLQIPEAQPLDNRRAGLEERRCEAYNREHTP